MASRSYAGLFFIVKWPVNKIKFYDIVEVRVPVTTGTMTHAVELTIIFL